jgi:hypothetical protein
MPQVRLHDPRTGKYQDFNIRPFAELTVADWYDITNPPIAEGISELDATYELIQRWVKIPKAKLRRMPPAEVERLVTALGTMLGEATKAKMDEFTPEATFAHDGITYSVPQNIEADTTFGQWADLNSRLEGMTADADMLPVICAVLLVPEGTEYEGSDLDSRIVAMRALPAAYALKLTAFFFASGSRLQSVMNQYLSRKLTSALQVLQQELSVLSDATDGSAPSTDSPSSSPSS